MTHGRPVQERFTLAELGRVYWPSTAKLALCRGFCAGLVWAAIMSTAPAPHAEFPLLLMPFTWAFLALPTGLILQLAGMILPAVIGVWLMLLGALFVCIGDPLVYVINRAWPGALNVADFRLFNFRPMIFVLLPD